MAPLGAPPERPEGRKRQPDAETRFLLLFYTRMHDFILVRHFLVADPISFCTKLSRFSSATASPGHQREAKIEF